MPPSPSSWTSVRIGGGGYVIGLVPSSLQQGLVYIRTDVGGAYRSDGNAGWYPITDSMQSSDLFGGDSIQADTIDPNIVYYAGGMYDYNPGCLFKSVNQGNNWTCTLPVKGGSNQNNRFAGERIFVDLVNGSRLLFGSRYEGLYQSVDAAARWTSVGSNIPLDKYSGTGIPCIFADPSSTTSAPFNITQILYLANYNDSIYTSSDGGDSWESIGGPRFGLRGAVSQDGKYVYISGGLKNSTGVSRYDVAAKSWSDITPNTSIITDGYIYVGIAVHASEPGLVIASTRYPNRWQNPVYRSLDYGQTWSRFSDGFIFNNTVPWWSKYTFQEADAAIQIDPFDAQHAWITDFSGTWTTYNLNASQPLWTNIERGHEEVVVMCLSFPPGGNLQSGCADACGFNHIDLDQYPNQARGTGDTTGLDFAGLKPNSLVSAQTIRYENRGGGYYSLNGGESWNPFKNQIGLGGKITVSADGSTIVWAPINRPLQTSKDMGQTWSTGPSDLILITVAGPTDIWHYWEPLYADRANASVIYCAKWGVFYRSEDGGVTWQNVSSVVYNPGTYDLWGVRATSTAGDVWYWSGSQNVLQHSVDYGSTWVNITSVTRINQIAFGKNRDNSEISTLYILGSISGKAGGVYRSEDAGATWTTYDITGLPLPLAQEIAADLNIFGRIYIGTNGRGIFYADMD